MDVIIIFTVTLHYLVLICYVTNVICSLQHGSAVVFRWACCGDCKAQQLHLAPLNTINLYSINISISSSSSSSSINQLLWHWRHNTVYLDDVIQQSQRSSACHLSIIMLLVVTVLVCVDWEMKMSREMFHEMSLWLLQQQVMWRDVIVKPLQLMLCVAHCYLSFIRVSSSRSRQYCVRFPPEDLVPLTLWFVTN